MEQIEQNMYVLNDNDDIVEKKIMYTPGKFFSNCIKRIEIATFKLFISYQFLIRQSRFGIKRSL